MNRRSMLTTAGLTVGASALAGLPASLLFEKPYREGMKTLKQAVKAVTPLLLASS